MRDTSSRSLISASRCCPDPCTNASWRCCSSFNGPASPPCSTVVKPRIEFSGVRSSWLIVARNSDLRRSSSRSRRFASDSSRVRSCTRCSRRSFASAISPSARLRSVISRRNATKWRSPSSSSCEKRISIGNSCPSPCNAAISDASQKRLGDPFAISRSMAELLPAIARMRFDQAQSACPAGSHARARTGRAQPDSRSESDGRRR